MQSLADSTPAETALQFFRDHPEVKLVNVQSLDLCGVPRGRLVPKQSFLNLLKAGRYFNDTPINLALTVTSQIIPEIFAHIGDAGKLTPDVDSLRVAAHDAASIGNVAVVMAESTWMGMDPRTNLKKTIARAETEAGMKFLFGFELEITFIAPNTLDLLVDLTGFALSSANQRSVLWPILNEVAVALAEAGIHIEQIIKESGASQWEIALPPLPPLESVDAYVYARDLVKNVAHKHGVLATLYPAPRHRSKKTSMNGQHIHMSATPVKESADWDPDTVMAGILSHIPALMAVGMTQAESYSRVANAAMGAGSLVAWGEQHRDVPVRRISENHWEIRSHDVTSNPYTMVAGLIGAAMDRKPLTIKPVKAFPISDEERKEGDYKPLPTSLPEALGELEKDRQWAETVFGENFLKWYGLLKKHEMKTLEEMEETSRRLMMLNQF